MSRDEDHRHGCDSVTTPSSVTVSQADDGPMSQRELERMFGAEANAPPPARKPVIVSASGLLKHRFPPQVKLLSPWLLSQSLSMLYAPRGIGKTHVAMGIAYALATGGEFLRWKAEKPVPVLYVDGEMAGAELQDRCRRITEAGGVEPGENLKFMTPDMQPEGVMPNLFNAAGQEAVTAAAESSKVVIVDNLSALVRGGKENEAESWQPVADWALRMRASGRSVLFIHHAGKTGQQRGTSKREDLLNIVIALRHPADYEPEQGARFEVHFEKFRALFGEDVSPIEARLTTGKDGKQAWECRTAAESIDEQLLEIMQMGMSQGEAAAELHVSRRTIIRHLQRLQREGRYTPPKKKAVKAAGNVVEFKPKKCKKCDGEGCEWCI